MPVPKTTLAIARREMRFPTGTAMAGFSRPGGALGTRDPLSITVLLWQRGQSACCLIVADLLNLGDPWQGHLRNSVHRLLPGCEVMVSCTHTHSGPLVDAASWPTIAATLEATLCDALAQAQPLEIGFGKVSHDGFLAYNRRALRRGFEPVDREVSWIALRTPEGDPRGLLFHYACHVAVFGPENRHFSADWPGMTVRLIRETLGTNIPIAFLQGTSGDLNTGYAAELSALGDPIGNRNEATAHFISRTLAQTVTAALPAQTYIPATFPEISHTTVEFTWNRSPSATQAREEAERARIAMETATDANPTLREALRCEAYLAQLTEERRGRFNLPNASSRLNIPMSLWRLQDCAALIPFPGEFFVEAGLTIKRQSPLPYPFPLGLTNGSLSYIPPLTAFDEGGYEVAASRFAPGSSEQWVNAALSLLHSFS